MNGFGINWTEMSLFYCKFRSFYVQFSILMSFTCMCLSIIDQYFATCSNPRWHKFNNIKLARYILLLGSIIWILHGIPFLLYYNHIPSSITGQINCVIININFQRYSSYFHTPFLISALPIIIIIIFGILSYRNVKQIAYRTIPLVRRELDRQLTIMVLIEGFYDVIAVTPLVIQTISFLIIGNATNLDTLLKLNFIKTITTVLHNAHFAVSIIYLILLKYFNYFLGIILYICYCIKKISSTIVLCFI